jgi:[acyl-carrier-protein] S-malonyltransferase
VELAAAVSGVGFLTPAFPVWSNTTAVPANDIGASLVAQLTAPVRFAESLVAMRDAGVDAFVHIGPGDVTAGMAKRTVAGAEVFAVTGPEDVPAVAAALSVQFRPPEGGS